MNYINYSTDLFAEQASIYRKYLPIVSRVAGKFPKTYEWDIPYTIKELSYLVHSHYRYYGKFPSVVAGQILEEFQPPSSDHYVLDNFCGSGTTLVEAKLRNINSYGLDISWLSVLASNVKAKRIDTNLVKEALSEIIAWVERNKNSIQPPEDNFALKWFSKETTRDLLAIQTFISKMSKSDTRDFLIVAFIGIVRRVSKAYDGEVRPHINKSKKQRDVIPAFVKKVHEMCSDHDDYLLLTNNDALSECLLGNNLKLPEIFNDGNCYLVISHPPYLNSFNYAPVFSLEFYWGEIFEIQYGGQENYKLYKTEMCAHPANESITEKYFSHLQQCYEETYRIQNRGGYLAIVVGDCTRMGELIPVIDNTIEIVTKIGYQLHEINYRTTHFGLGKYAYKHRADYHGEGEEKKDGIIIFKK